MNFKLLLNRVMIVQTHLRSLEAFSPSKQDYLLGFASVHKQSPGRAASRYINNAGDVTFHRTVSHVVATQLDRALRVTAL